MKGIILAGGKGTRLYPLTKSVNKHLLPIYNKPMIYYPLSMLMLAKIKEILVISSGDALESLTELLRDGSQWGLDISYAAQQSPKGIADSFIIGEEFIENQSVALLLGDNVFYGSTLPTRLQNAAKLNKGALIFAYQVQDPGRYAIIEIENQKDGKVVPISLEEKPKTPRSSYAVPGLYFYDNQVVEFAKSLEPSKRGELEITDINNIYLRQNQLHVDILGRGIAWLDVGTHASLLQASSFVQTIESRQGMMISCLEEIALRLGFITTEEVEIQAKSMGDTPYQKYLLRLLEEFRTIQDKSISTGEEKDK